MTTNTTFMTSNKDDLKMDYYLYKDSFGEDIKSVPYLDVSEGTLKNPIIKYKPLPKDIKRLISRGDKTFTSRIYFISAEELDTANLNVKAMQASVDAAQATLKQAQWQLAQTEIRAPVSGWVTNLTTRIGDYADTGKPLFALVDSHSFYVIGYFEETKLRHIREGAPAQITLYSDNKTLQGHVSSIGRAIYDQSVESDSSLIPDVKPNVPWVRLAQRVPVRFALDKVPGDVTLVSGTTCSIAVGQ